VLGRQASSVSLQRLFLCIVLVVGLSNAVAAGTIQLVIVLSTCHRLRPTLKFERAEKNQEPDATSCATVLDRSPTASQNLSLLPKRVR
jgi:hypothetical protein